MSKLKIKKGDKVKVITGNSKGKISVVTQVLPKESKVVVEGVNVVTKHQKPTSGNPNGAINKVEAPIHISNVMLLDSTNNMPTRVGRRLNNEGELERFSKKSGKTI